MDAVMRNEIDFYKMTHERSLKLWEIAKKRLPGGVSHNIRDFNMSFFKLGPPFIQQAKGSKIIDVDDNTYLDYWMTHGSAILGHSHHRILSAINEQLPKGNHYGMVNETSLDLAAKIIKTTPGIEKLRFCTTGTEATMYASRLARAFTKRKKIAKLKGGWHGGNDTLFYFVKHLEDGIESQGIKTLKEADILTFDYNHTEQASEIIQEHKNELAAIIMEPVMGAGGAIPPREGFLETIREETEKNDILLIFDEIITGFRLSFHSAQGLFDITPDLTTMGKVVGGGAPIGVIGGREDILETANMQNSGKVWIGGGTFSGNPVSMVAGLATINVLEEEKNNLYPKINDYGVRLREEICKIIDRYNMPAVVTGFGSMSCIHWFKNPKTTISSSSEIQLDGNPIMNKKLQLLLFNRGLLVRTGLGYISFQHTKEDFTKTLKAIDESIQILSKN